MHKLVHIFMSVYNELSVIKHQGNAYIFMPVGKFTVAVPKAKGLKSQTDDMCISNCSSSHFHFYKITQTSNRA